MAFIVIRARNTSGSSRKGHTIAAAAASSATNAPVATDSAIASTVTWFAVTPARASRATSGRSNSWKRGFSA